MHKMLSVCDAGGGKRQYLRSSRGVVKMNVLVYLFVLHLLIACLHCTCCVAFAPKIHHHIIPDRTACSVLSGQDRIFLPLIPLRCRSYYGVVDSLSRQRVHQWSRYASSSENGNDEVQNNDLQTTPISHEEHNRRSFLTRTAISITSGASTQQLVSSCIANGGFSSSNVANARGLVRFPCKEPLLNSYNFMRAGTSLLEAEDVWSTNPLFLTNREAALSEIGQQQVSEACAHLRSTGINPTVVRYSLAAASIDSANIVGEELKIGRDRLVPEFNYLDPRAIGGWDFAALNATEEAVWALDADEAGPYGKGGRPPSNEDGTPAETLSDQVVRLTNLMSVLETLYSGDTILLIFPDGTGPALLSCLMGGIPLNRVHEFNFKPGEVRIGVEYNSINSMALNPPSTMYNDIIERGRNELKVLREEPNIVRNIKDLKYEEEKRADEERERNQRELKRKEEAKVNGLKRQQSRATNDQQLNSNLPENSFGSAPVGLAGALVAIAGGIGVASSSLQGDNSTTAVTAALNSTEQLEPNSTELAFDAGTELDDDSLLLDADKLSTDEDNLDVLYNKERSTLSGFNDGENEQKPKIDLEEDWDDAWLGAITDIMNDVETQDEGDNEDNIV